MGECLVMYCVTVPVNDTVAVQPSQHGLDSLKMNLGLLHIDRHQNLIHKCYAQYEGEKFLIWRIHRIQTYKIFLRATTGTKEIHA